MTLPNGFQVKVFAAEPDVVQPFCFCFDERGRMWVSENLNYRTRGVNEDEPLSRFSTASRWGETLCRISKHSYLHILGWKSFQRFEVDSPKIKLEQSSFRIQIDRKAYGDTIFVVEFPLRKNLS
jgi:hypothetical protein